jgi:2-iminobutanoate/2-iminopropanoate deaminase
VGPYSPALRSGPLLFISGQVPLDPATGSMVDGDIATHTRRALDNVGLLLKAAGLSFAHVVRTTVFLADMNDFKAMNEVYATYFTEPYPARSTVQAARLPRDARIEIDAIATYE